MNDIKFASCPFCGWDYSKDSLKNPTITYKRDRKKILGVYHEICTFRCGGCTCSIRQAGINKEEAYKAAVKIWNRSDGKQEWVWDSEADNFDFGAYRCSGCGRYVKFKENFCPDCGSEMENVG